MDGNRDELRRQLAESRRDHAESLPRFREALHQLFHGKDPGSTADKARLLGVPSRRSFLTIGGVTVVGSAILVGCGQTPTNQIAQTGTTPVQPSSTTTTDPTSHTTDLTMMMTASSIEVLAIQTYQKALDSGVLTTAGIKSAIELFQSQHEDHANLLYTTTSDSGGTPYKTANLYLGYEVVGPALETAKTEADIVTLATELENLAAQTYTQAAGVMTTPTLRGALSSIGATESRHLTALYLAQQLVPVPLPLGSTAKAAPPDSYIVPNKDTPPKGVPAKAKDLLPTPTTAASS